MDLEELKLFLRLDGSDDDTLIQSLELAAVEYLTNAGVNKDYTKALYKLAIKLLVGHWYENRSIVASDNNVAFNLDTMITQLKSIPKKV